MAGPQIVAVASGSPAERAGLRPGDEVAAIAGEAPRDVIRWQLLSDGAEVRLEVERAGDRFAVVVNKREGEPLGAEVDAAVFDGVQTCDNHCEFCFVHQLPRGMRRSLYLKDDDYRLSFLYGNFTTLTRFTELDFERVVTERLSPLYVSIHSTDPDVRAAILQNRRGAVSLRWLRLLLDAGIEVHGQVVVCPGVNDGDVLDDTLAGVLDRFAELRTLCVVPLGLSRYNRQPRMRLHTRSEAAAVVDIVERWQSLFLRVLGRRLAFVADEYYLMCGRGFPAAEHYEGFEMHEDGIGMARSFETEFLKDGHQPDPAAVGLLRLGGRRARRRVPGAPPGLRGRGGGCRGRRPRRWRCRWGRGVPAATAPSRCSPAPWARPSCRRWSRRWGAATRACCRSRTASSAATSV